MDYIYFIDTFLINEKKTRKRRRSTVEPEQIFGILVKMIEILIHGLKNPGPST